MLFISSALITRNLANYIKSYLREVVDRGLQITKNYLKFYNLILEYLCRHRFEIELLRVCQSWMLIYLRNVFYKDSSRCDQPPNFAVGPIILTAILFPQPAVDIRYPRRLPNNSDIMKLKRIFQGPMKTWPFSASANLWSFWTIIFKNGGLCVRALLCHQGRSNTIIFTILIIVKAI